MAWIKVIPPQEAEGELAEAYEGMGGGHASNIARVASLNPKAMLARHQFSHVVTFGGSCLGRVREELLAVVVSAALECTYWTVSHGEFLREATGRDEAFVLQVKQDHHKAGLEPRDVAMLDYAVRLTKEPAQVSEADVAALRAAGWSDREILDICLVTCYRNFIARLADGLGVELGKEFAGLDEAYRQGLKGAKDV